LFCMCAYVCVYVCVCVCDQKKKVLKLKFHSLFSSCVFDCVRRHVTVTRNKDGTKKGVKFQWPKVHTHTHIHTRKN